MTTKNTVAGRPPMRRLTVTSGDCNGPFKIVTDFSSEKDQQLLYDTYKEWFDHPSTSVWHVDMFIIYLKDKFPNRICVKHEEYQQMIKDGEVIPGSREQWLAEQN